MRLTIHRGSHEIGGSCAEIAAGDSRIVIDIGMPLVKPDGSRFDAREHEHKTVRELVQQKILPDIPGMYDGDTRRAVDGLLISHAHSDHHGFLKHVRKDIPCYLGAGTKELLGINDLFMRQRNDIRDRPYTLFERDGIHKIGAFTVTPFLMDHSAFDANAFLVECGGKRVVYSGDFRGHGRKPGALGRFLNSVPKGVDALLLEGTLVGREDDRKPLKTEAAIEGEMVKAIEESGGPVFCSVSGQNIDRLVTIYRAAARTGRTLVIDLYTAAVLDALKGAARIPTPTGGYPNIAVYCPSDQRDKLKKSDRKDLLDRLRKWRWDDVVRNLPRCVVLVRTFAIDKLRQRDNIDGATMIYSLWGGYLKDESSNELLSLVGQKKMKLVQIHTSGHADPATLKKVVDALKPRMVVPVHTFGADRFPDLFPDARVVRAGDGVGIEL